MTVIDQYTLLHDACSRQSSGVAVEFAEWISYRYTEGIDRQKGMWFDHTGECVAKTTAELYQLFNPSGAAPQADCPTGEDGDLNCPVLDAVYEGAAQWEERCRSAEEALRYLVILKDWKENSGKDSVYVAQQPLAWIAAKTHLATYEGYEKGKSLFPTPPPPAGPVTGYATLLEALDSIAHSTTFPVNEEQAYSWIKTAQDIADEAIRKYNSEGRAPHPPAGPVWVKASNRVPDHYRNVHVRYKILHFGEPVAASATVKYNVSTNKWLSQETKDFEGHIDLEWLDESNSQQLFTREQVDMAFYAACNIINYEALKYNPLKGEFIARIHKEYMDKNFPQ